MNAQVAGRQRASAELRRAIQESKESVRTLCERHGINPKTVRRWRGRSSIESRKTGPQTAKSSVLSAGQEALIVAFREMTLLPLDDCLYALQAFIPDLTRASLHRCLRRHGISRLPTVARDDAPGSYDIHLLRLDEAEYGLCLFVALERASKFLFAELHETPTAAGSAEFVHRLVRAAPGRVRTVYAAPHRPVSGPTPEFALACVEEGIHHRLAEARWAREQLDELNVLIRQAARRSVAEESLDTLRDKLGQFTAHYNTGCRLKALGGLAPLAYISRRKPEPTPSRGRPAAPRRARAAPPERVPRDPHGTREAILQAARALLAKVGPEGLSLSQVARVAGVNRGTAYQHFKSRSQLIAATAAWSSEQLTTAVFGVPAYLDEQGNGRFEVSQTAKRLADFTIRNPEIGQAWLFQVLTSADPWEDPFWRQYRGSGERFHATPMAQKDIDGEVLAITTLAGSFLWPIWARAKARDNADLQAYADRFARESLRYAMYGALTTEYFPELAAELATPLD